jgi:hypothetical protein
MIKFITLYLLLCCPTLLIAQKGFILSKEGSPILNKKEFVSNCLRSLHKDRTDATAVQICECQVSKVDRHFTNKQYKKVTEGRVINLQTLFDSDSLIEKSLRECYTSSGKTILLQAEGFEEVFISSCKNSIIENTERKLSEATLNQFCNCQLNMVKAKKLTDTEMATLSNPNSLLFYETMFTCGDPFKEKEANNRNWNNDLLKDIDGPLTDTITVLNMEGMTYLKMKTGSLVQFWLFDTGASDLLINKDMEATLKDEGILTQQNYLGIGEYEMANGLIDTCRKYTINKVQLGKYSLNNIVVAVTDKGRRIIAGRSLLNKFSYWSLDNKSSKLILTK